MAKVMYNIVLDDGECATAGGNGISYRGRRPCDWHLTPKMNPSIKPSTISFGTVLKNGFRHDLFALSMTFPDKKTEVIGIKAIIETDFP